MRVQHITTAFDVKIKFPEKSLSATDSENDHVNGQQSTDIDSLDDSPKPCDVIRITGKYISFFSFRFIFIFPFKILLFLFQVDKISAMQQKMPFKH